ncbi:hypothetical protein SSYRP_v1c07910 [Spiroplasma syrphidicola EA-1]|uniref:Transmembrane protein n=1 Tax=Spiroplasma syrphidicola EA-1 TaxID=1276229 RepID=R4UMB9_9MOLU|nr:hypothetical protein [Spiroplasma syrphidicola]AGM26381.1 hypothetical protein SSYRP_v1c07910 [Spiroplasma syrphidicola EA-1]
MRRIWINLNLNFFLIILFLVFATISFAMTNSLIMKDSTWNLSTWTDKYFSLIDKTYSVNWKVGEVITLLMATITGGLAFIGINLHLIFMIKDKEISIENIILTAVTWIFLAVIVGFYVTLVFDLTDYSSYLNTNVMRSGNVWKLNFAIQSFTDMQAGIFEIIAISFTAALIPGFIGYYVYTLRK